MYALVEMERAARARRRVSAHKQLRLLERAAAARELTQPCHVELVDVAQHAWTNALGVGGRRFAVFRSL